MVYLNRYGRCYKCAGAEELGAEKSPGKPTQGHQNHDQYENNSNRKNFIEFSFTKTHSTEPNTVKSINCKFPIFFRTKQREREGKKQIRVHYLPVVPP